MGPESTNDNIGSEPIHGQWHVETMVECFKGFVAEDQHRKTVAEVVLGDHSLRPLRVTVSLVHGVETHETHGLSQKFTELTGCDRAFIESITIIPPNPHPATRQTRIIER